MSEQGFHIKRAKRHHARLRTALSGVSGAGKTKGALRLAKGIVQKMMELGLCDQSWDGKIALIDTERKSASLYADTVPFDVIELEPPYSVDRYQQALSQIERGGYAICIIDQISHAWAGPGGQLEWIDTLKAAAKNAISPWSKVTPVQQEFYDRMLRSPLNLIITMRAKSEWVIEDVQDSSGRTKKVPKKIGLSPVQREGIEYEFTSVLDIELESHMATASKDRTELFADRTVKLDEELGAKLAEWLYRGEGAAPEEPKPEGAAAGAGAGGGAQGGEGSALSIEQLEESLSLLLADIQLEFVSCSTLPDLAAQFDSGQKAIKAFVPKIGPEKVKPALDKLIAAKDKRKAEIAAPAAEQQKPPEPAAEQQRKPEAEPKLGKNDLKTIRLCIKGARLDEAEILKQLGVAALEDLPLKRMAETTGLIAKMSKKEAAAAGK